MFKAVPNPLYETLLGNVRYVAETLNHFIITSVISWCYAIRHTLWKMKMMTARCPITRQDMGCLQITAQMSSWKLWKTTVCYLTSLYPATGLRASIIRIGTVLTPLMNAAALHKQCLRRSEQFSYVLLLIHISPAFWSVHPFHFAE